MEIKQPHNEHELELAIVRRAGNSNAKAVSDRMVMANAIVGQLLGEGVAVKGGSSMLLRYGSENARFTEDWVRRGVRIRLTRSNRTRKRFRSSAILVFRCQGPFM